MRHKVRQPSITFEATATLTATVERYGAQIGSDGVAEILITTLDQDMQRRGINMLSQREHREAQGLAATLRTEVPSVPAVPRALEAVLNGQHTDAASTRSSAPKAASRHNCAAVIEQICAERIRLAEHAADIVGPNRTIYAYGAGFRFQAAATCITALYGTTRIFISGPERIGMTDYDVPARIYAEDLYATMGAALGHGAVPTILPVRLPNAALAVSQADHLFILTMGVGPYGELVAPPGAELVYHAAVAKGIEVLVLVTEDDLLTVSSLPHRPMHYTVLQPEPGVRFITPTGEVPARDFLAMGQPVFAAYAEVPATYVAR